MSDATTCRQLIQDWDNGELIRSVEMGGLGPSYEQAIQITMVEAIRYLVNTQVPEGPDPIAETWWLDEKNTTPLIEKLSTHIMNLDQQCDWGLSGAQFDAALNAAMVFYRHGHKKGYEKAPDDRRILISNQWPKTPNDCLPKFPTP